MELFFICRLVISCQELGLGCTVARCMVCSTEPRLDHQTSHSGLSRAYQSHLRPHANRLSPRPSELFPFAVQPPQFTLPTNKHSAVLSMSYTHLTAASSSSFSTSSSNFQRMINTALDTYKTRTRKDLLAHPLTAQLQACDSPTAILALLQQQVQGLDQFRSTDERWTKWLDPTVNVLSAFSDILGAGVSLVCFRTSNSLSLALLYLCPRYSPLRPSSSPVSESSSQCVSLITLRGPL